MPQNWLYDNKTSICPHFASKTSFRTCELQLLCAIIRINMILPYDFCDNHPIRVNTVMILSFRIDRPRQTVWIKLLLKKQSDQGLNCLLFHLYFWMQDSMVKPPCSNVRVITAICLGVQNFRIFTVP